MTSVVHEDSDEDSYATLETKVVSCADFARLGNR